MGKVKVNSTVDTNVIFTDIETEETYEIGYITSGVSEAIQLECGKWYMVEGAGDLTIRPVTVRSIDLSGCENEKGQAYFKMCIRDSNKVVIQTSEGEKTIECDSVVLSVGYVPGTSLAKESSEHVHILGDAAKVGNLKSVIWGAYDLAFLL